MILKKNYLFLSVLFAVAFSLVACSKGTRFLVVEGTAVGNYKLYITNSKGDKNKTDITPSLPDGYTFNGTASFINANKQRILVGGVLTTNSLTIRSETGTANSTTSTSISNVTQSFTCNLRGKDIVKIESTSLPVNATLRDHR